MGEVYRLEFCNGKSYVGITTKTAAERFEGHKKRCRSGIGDGTALYAAWKKHGEPKLFVLAVVEDKELAATEVRAVRVYGTKAPSGYNMTIGGDFPPLKDPNIAKKLLGNKHALGSKHERNSEYRQKLSKALMGNKNGLGNSGGLGKKNAAGKRSGAALANIRAGVARKMASRQKSSA
jgi:predicted GIY-YIG superfamily endonuclease